jgi:hypothetical protein
MSFLKNDFLYFLGRQLAQKDLLMSKSKKESGNVKLHYTLIFDCVSKTNYWAIHF